MIRQEKLGTAEISPGYGCLQATTSRRSLGFSSLQTLVFIIQTTTVFYNFDNSGSLLFIHSHAKIRQKKFITTSQLKLQNPYQSPRPISGTRDIRYKTYLKWITLYFTFKIIFLDKIIFQLVARSTSSSRIDRVVQSVLSSEYA